MKPTAQLELLPADPRTETREVSGYELPAVLEQVRREGGHVEGVRVKGASYSLTIRHCAGARETYARTR